MSSKLRPVRMGDPDTSSTRLAAYFFAGAALLLCQYAYILLVEDFYPSISLPGVGATVRNGADILRDQMLVFAVTAEGTRLKVDEHELLSILPGQYRVFVIKNGFGLLPESHTSDDDARVARAWIRERLQSQLGSVDVVALEVVHARYTALSTPPRRYIAVSAKRVDL